MVRTDQGGAAAAALAPPAHTRLPGGFTVGLASDVFRSRDGRLMLGGSPPRLLRLTAWGARQLDGGTLTVSGPASAALARRLLDIGAAHPAPPAASAPATARDPAAGLAEEVTIVIPVRDRAGLLDRLLTQIRADPQTAALPVLVVDDASADAAGVAAAARRHRAALLAHLVNQGPAAARNTGLRQAATRFVAFCDADVLPWPGWLGVLAAQFTDPAVALAAPRVRTTAGPGPSWLDRYEHALSPLDLGAHPAPVRPLSPVSYVPGAVLLVRRHALGGGFAEDLRVAEDVRPVPAAA